MPKYIVKHVPSERRFRIYKQTLFLWQEYLDSVHYGTTIACEGALAEAQSRAKQFKEIDERLNRR